MVTDLYGALLEEFGHLLGIKLTPDPHNTCLIKSKGGSAVQIEIDAAKDSLLIVSTLPELPLSGRYRESVMKEALIANNLPPPRYGIFAFSKPAGRMILFAYLDLRNLNGEKIYAFFNPFAAKAQTWYDAISQGVVPVVSSQTTPKPGGIFGIRP